MPHVTAAVALFDGTGGTGTSRSFAPRKMGFGTGTFSYPRDVTDTPVKQVSIDVAYSESTPKRPTTRTNFECTYPILRDVAGVRTINSIGRASATFIVPDEMTEVEAGEMLAYLTNAILTSTFKVSVTKREPIWG